VVPPPLIILVIDDDGQQRGTAVYHMPCITGGLSTTHSLIFLLLSQMSAGKGMQKFSGGFDQSRTHV